MELRRNSRRRSVILENYINGGRKHMIKGGLAGMSLGIAISILTVQYIPNEYQFLYGVLLGFGCTTLGMMWDI